MGSKGKTITRQLNLDSYGPSSNEINFFVVNPNKVLGNSDDLTIIFLPNNLIKVDSVYVMTLTLKEQIVYSQ
jgi:hypothetical protein